MKLLTHTAAPSPLGLSCCFSRSFSYSECCCCFFTIILFTSFVARYVTAKVPEVPDPILQPDLSFQAPVVIKLHLLKTLPASSELEVELELELKWFVAYWTKNYQQFEISSEILNVHRKCAA